MPREVATLFKLGFYNVMTHPLIKIYDSIQNHDSCYKHSIRDAISKSLLLWPQFEAKLPEKVQTLIADLVVGNKPITMREIDDIIESSVLARLLHGTEIAFTTTTNNSTTINR